MDEALFWKILNINPTKNETEIKERYHELLRDVNPEDDPEGFKRLRQAYEGALELAKAKEETETGEKKPKDEIDLWLERIQEIYWYNDTRNDPEVWREAFQDPVCIALDTALEARDRFLVFLMSHNYLGQTIWQIIDKEFNIIADQQELLENFPKDFLDFLCYQIKNPNFFAYEYLEITGLDESEIQLDSYIGAYMRIKGQINREEYEGDIWQQLDDLKAYEVYHPYEDVERVRLYLRENRIEEAAALLPKLEGFAGEDAYIAFYTGRIYSEQGNDAKALEYWNWIIEERPEHNVSYFARIRVIRYLLKQQDYLTAKDRIMELFEINGRDETVLELMREVNLPLIEYYRSLAEKEPENKQHMVEACWCMFQNEMFQETLNELEALQIQPEEAEYYDYVNMKGRCFLGLEKYEEAIPYLLRWDECRKNLIDDGSEKYQKRQSREGFIKSAIGAAYQNLKRFDEAEAYLKEGIRLEQDKAIRLPFMDRLALLYYDNEKYESCVDVCTDIIEEDPGYYPAYLRRQQAYHTMRNGQGVVDDYYNAIRVYSKYYKPYLLALEVFCAFHQYEDAKKVIETAKEQGVEHETLKFYEIRVCRHLAQSEEEYRQIMELCQRLKQELKAKALEKEKTETELVEEEMWRDSASNTEVNMEELTYEEILIYMDLGQSDVAMKMIVSELKKGNQDFRLHYIKADIHQMQKEYPQALTEYNWLSQRMPDNDNIDFDRGLCLRKMNRTEEALQAFQTALKKNPEHPRANHEMMRIYSKWFDNYELRFAYGEALRHINAQLKNDPDAYYYIERGLLYMDNYNMDMALADYKKALELEPDNLYAYNNIGYVLRMKKQFQQAIPYFQQSISHMKEGETLLPYTNMAKCYEALYMPKRGIEVLQEALKVFPESSSLHKTLGELYQHAGQYGDAKEIYKKAFNDKLLSQTGFYKNMVKTCILENSLQEAEEYLKKWVSITKKDTKTNADWDKRMEAFEQMGTYYFFRRELKQAVKFLEKAVKIAVAHHFYYAWAGRNLALSYMLLHQPGKAKAMAAQTMEMMMRGEKIPFGLLEREPEDPQTERAYLSYRPLAASRLNQFALFHACMGNWERAEEYEKKSEQIPMCRNCGYGACSDAFLTLAYFAEIRGDIAKAIEWYKQTLKYNPADEEAKLIIQTLQKKIER